MLQGLIALIKESNPTVLKKVLIEFVFAYVGIEKQVNILEKKVEQIERYEVDDTVRITLENILFDDMAKIDGKIEILDEFEEKLTNTPDIKNPFRDAYILIGEMIADYEKRVIELKSETLKMYYGIKIDTLNELKQNLI